MLRFQKYNKSPDDKTWQRSFWMSRCQTLHIIGDKCWQLYKHLFVSKPPKSETKYYENSWDCWVLWLIGKVVMSLWARFKKSNIFSSKKATVEKSQTTLSSVTHRKGGNESVRWTRFKKSHIFSSFLPWLILLLLKSAIWLTQTFDFCRRLLLLILLQTKSPILSHKIWGLALSDKRVSRWKTCASY